MAENLETYRPEMTRDRRKKPRVQTRGFWLVEHKPLCPTRRGLDDTWSTSARGLNPVLPLHHIRSHAITHGLVQHHGPVEGRRVGAAVLIGRATRGLCSLFVLPDFDERC